MILPLAVSAALFAVASPPSGSDLQLHPYPARLGEDLGSMMSLFVEQSSIKRTGDVAEVWFLSVPMGQRRHNSGKLMEATWGRGEVNCARRTIVMQELTYIDEQFTPFPPPRVIGGEPVPIEDGSPDHMAYLLACTVIPAADLPPSIRTISEAVRVARTVLPVPPTPAR